MARPRIDWWHALGLILMAASAALVLLALWALAPYVAEALR